ncbi:ABC transporter ATP-binding protein [Metaclostridioides mangenotii]|uniref:ABC transporter ATP-binding protein n=1 Tax=Metaclostridioides mangenotii TaxID=1540 RepID=UPI0028E61324|nr:ABC transporter ATP-binding protein [Clostridioides mangenotii]
MKNKNLIRFSKLILKKNKTKLFISFFLVILVAVIDLYTPQVTKNILDNGIGNKNINLLIKLTFIYSVLRISGALIDLILEYLYTVMKNKVTISLKVKLLNHLSNLSGRYFSGIKTGNLLSIVEQDIFIIENFSAEILFSILVDIFTAAISLLFLMTMSQDLLLIVILIQVILIVIQSKMRKYISKKTSDIRESSGNLSNIVQEYVSNIMNIVISKSKLKFFKEYIKREKCLMREMMGLNLVMVGNVSVSRILSGFITATIYGYGGYKIIKGRMSIGELIAFQQYTNMLIGPCINIIRSSNRIEQAKISIDRVYSVIDEPVDIETKLEGYKIKEIFIEEIELRDVSFYYKEESSGKEHDIHKDVCNINKFVLKDINMRFKKGKITAIVGGSGCGKSTIVNLLYRLWDVYRGDILFDGINIKNINLRSLRSNINIVSQDIFLLDDTIRNNISVDNKITDNNVKKICKVVGLDDFVTNLEDGVDTLVGERGVKLSGGQKQRIAIARALNQNGKILILDEATSALDNISQSEIINNISEYLSDKIVIVIAHRLSTIKNADNIYVLEDGNVVESGREKELLIKGGLYKKLSGETN